MKQIAFGVGIETRKFERDADKVNQKLRNIGTTATREGTAIDKLGTTLSRNMGRVLSVTAVLAYGKHLANVRGEFESLEIAIETFLGSKAKADELMAQIAKTAAITPFTMQEVSQGAQQLLAFGIEAENVDKTLRELGNVASGVNKSLGDVISPFGRIMSTGRVVTLDLLTMARQGVPVYEELAKQLGVTTEQIGGMATEGQITREHIVKMFQDMSAEGGKFAGLMEKQALGTKGLQANLGVAIEAMTNDLGKKLQPAINGALQGGIDLAENYEKVARVVGELIVTYGAYRASLITLNAVQRVNVAITRQAVLEKHLATKAGIALTNQQAIAAARTKLFNTATRGLTASMRALWATMLANPYALLAGVIAGAGYALYKLTTYQRESEKVEARLQKAKGEGLKNYTLEITKLNDLGRKLSETNRDSQKYHSIKDSIVRQYGDYLPNLDKEIDKVGGLSGVYDDLTASIRKSMQERAITSMYTAELERVGESISKELPAMYDKIIEGFGREEGEKIYNEVFKYLTDESYTYEMFGKARSAIGKYSSGLHKDIMILRGKADNSKRILDKYQNMINTTKEEKAEEVLPIIFNHSYWEDIKKNAEEALKAMDVSKIGSNEWNELTQQILDATAQLDKYSQKEIEAKALTKDEIDLKRKVEGEKFNIAKLGVEDRLKLLEIERKEELHNLKLELEDKKYLQEDYNRLLLLIEDRYNVRRDLINKEENEKTRQALEDRLEEFKASEVQIQEIRDRYSKLRIEASGNELYDVKKINEAEAREIASIQGDLTEKLKSLFGDVSKYSVGHLKALKESFKSMLEGVTDVRPSDMKDLKEAFEQIENAIIDKDPFGALIPSINDYRETQEKLNKLKEEYNKLTPDERVKIEQDIAKAINEQAEAQYRLNKAINATGIKGMEFVQAGTAFTGMLESLGVGGQSKSIDKMLGGLGDMFGSMESMDITKPMSIITGSFEYIGGLAKLVSGIGRSITNIFGSSRKARRENERALEVLRKQNIELERQYAIKQATAKIDRATTIFGTDEWSRSKALAEQFVLERKELEKAYKELEQIEVVTGSYVSKSFWRSKVKKEWSGLLDAYPELIKANGDFNISLAESILATKELDKKGREALENLTEQAKSAEDVYNSLKDSMSGVFGELGASITDSFIQAYKSGEDATNLFVGNVSQSMDKLAKSMISSVVFTDILEKYQDALVKMRLDSSLTEADIIRESSKLMGGLAKELAGAEDEVFAMIGAYEQAMREQGLSGFEATKEVGAIVGQYQTLSEDTGNLLAGRANALLTYTGMIYEEVVSNFENVSKLTEYGEITADNMIQMRDLALTSIGFFERIAKGTDNLHDIREDITDMKNVLRDKL